MKRLNNKGFTLIELLIVVVILGVLIAIVIGATTGNKDRANDSKRKADLSRMQTALEECMADNQLYPNPHANAVPTAITDTCFEDAFEKDSGGVPQIPDDPEATQDYGYTSADGSTYTLTATLSDGTAFTLNNKQ